MYSTMYCSFIHILFQIPLQATVQTVKSDASTCGTTNNVVCTKYINGRICEGDSGGPLVAKSNGTWVLYGVAAFVDTNCASTGGNYGFMDVAHWTKTIISKVQANPQTKSGV